jgi:hypothetical protein
MEGRLLTAQPMLVEAAKHALPVLHSALNTAAVIVDDDAEQEQAAYHRQTVESCRRKSAVVPMRAS